MPRLSYSLDEKDLKRLVMEELQKIMPNQDINPDDVKIETRSKQNYKSEWERAEYRATYDKQ